MEGRDKCEIKLTKPTKFQYGRKDCIPTNPDRPFETTSEEVTPVVHGSAEEVLKFMRQQHGLSARDTIALMGIHGTVFHFISPNSNELEGIRYKWIGAPYFSNMFYKIITGKPYYKQKGGVIFMHAMNDRKGTVSVGDADGNPIGGVKFR